MDLKMELAHPRIDLYPVIPVVPTATTERWEVDSLGMEQSQGVFEYENEVQPI